MKIIHKVGDTLSQSVDFIVDKNRQVAHLNRLKAIIVGEQETLEAAYIALGKQYFAVLEGEEVTQADKETAAVLAETVRLAKLRLKKAKARYEYTLRYGVPKPGVKVEEAVDISDMDENGDLKEEDTEEQDITIAYADPTANDDAIIDAAIDEALQEEAAKKASDDDD